MAQQDPSATQHERIQQLRANIARDLALESTGARRQRQTVSSTTSVEPRRFLAASRLDVGRLKKRFERSETVYSRFKHWAVNPCDQSVTLQALPGVTSLEICKAKQVRASASLFSEEHSKPTGNYQNRAVDIQMPASDSHFDKTCIGSNMVDTALEEEFGAEPLLTECIDSQCMTHCTDASAEAAKDRRLTRSASGPTKKAMRKASVTQAAMEHVLKPPSEIAAAPQGTACVPSTDYVFMCVLLLVAVFQLLR